MAKKTERIAGNRMFPAQKGGGRGQRMRLGAIEVKVEAGAGRVMAS